MTSAGVTSEAAGIPARKDNIFAVGSRSHRVKDTAVHCRPREESLGWDWVKCLLAVASGKRSCDSGLPGMEAPPHLMEYTPRLAFPRPPTSISYAYIHTQSQGIMYQDNFKWLKTNGERFGGFFWLLFFYLFFLLSCWNQSYWVWFFRGEACYPFPLPASLRLLAVSGGAFSHTFNHSHPPNPKLSSYTRKTLLIAK